MDNTEQSGTSATLFYDGQCPLCMREMEKLRPLKSKDLCLQDIHQVDDNEALPDRDVLLRNLHLQTASGEFLIGLDANIAAWQGTSYGAMLRWLRWPLIRPIADMGYRWWAKWRYQRLYGGNAGDKLK